jgi:hypothetical protein
LSFAADTAHRAAADGGYDADIATGWDIGGNANGGYLLAIAGRAMAAAAGRPDPVTITAHYLSPGKPGPVHVDTSVVKEGKRFATVQATLRDASPGGGGRALLALLGTFGDLGPAGGAEGSPIRVDAAPPDLPPLEECVRISPREGAPFPPPFSATVEARLHPDDAGFATGFGPSGEPRVRGWFRFPGDETVDTAGLLVVVDAFPPTIFNAHLPMAWTPTVELTAHVRARPAPGWLRCVFTTRFVTGGFLEEDGEVWDATGTLVAQSRQLALVPKG